MKNKSILVIVAIIIIAVIAVIFEGGKKSSDRVVKIGYLSHSAGLPWAVEQKMNFLRSDDIAVEGVKFDSSNLMNDALVRGDIDVTFGTSLLPVLIAHNTDPGKLLIFGNTKLVSNKPFDSIIVKESSPIRTLSDLSDKKVGVFPGSTPTVFLKKLFTENNIPIDNIEFIQLPPPNQLQALESNAIDALYSYEPNLSIAKSKSSVRVIYGSVYAHFLEGAPIGVAVVSAKFVTENPVLAKRTIEGIEKTFDFIQDPNNKKTVEALAQEFLKLDADVVAMVDFPATIVSSLDKDAVTEFTKILLEFGELTIMPNMETVFYK